MSSHPSNRSLPVLRVDPVEFPSGIFVGITESGECVLRAYGEIETSSAELFAMKLTLMANRLRTLGATAPASIQLH